MEKNSGFSQRRIYTPTVFTEFLWWLSTAEKELLYDSVIDRNRYSIIGMTVLTTWAFATFAWAYFFSSIVSNFILALALGLFMGFIILTIDRALIKGITRNNKRKLWPLFFRGILALTIGTFMAQPALLYLFDKEIKLQISLDNEKRKMLKQAELITLYKTPKEILQNEVTSLQNKLTEKYKDVNNARNNFLAETDGSGGSGKVGIKDIAIAKRNEYIKLDTEYQALVKETKPALDSAILQLKNFDNKINTELEAFTLYLNNGFLTRVEALNNLIKANPALQLRYYLIVFILLLIELMPVIAKTILPSGSYEEKAALRENMEIEMAHTNTAKEKKLKELYNQLAFENDSQAIANFFDITKTQKDEKMKDFASKWADENPQTFDGLWKKMKQQILSKQEN